MTSSRLMLIFLGFIIIIIVVLSSNKIAGALKTRFGGFIPSLKPYAEKVTPTPSKYIAMISPTIAPTASYTASFTAPDEKGGKTGGFGQITNGSKTSNRNTYAQKGATPAKEIPATGPQDLVLLMLGGSFLGGIVLKGLTSGKSNGV